MKAYANASIVGPDRVVFNVKGNSYKLVVAINYPHQIVFIKWIGSRADYDQIDVKTPIEAIIPQVIENEW